jgi:hypothetical protein
LTKEGIFVGGGKISQNHWVCSARNLFFADRSSRWASGIPQRGIEMPWDRCDAAEADDRCSSTLKLVAFDKPTVLSLFHQRSTLDGMETPQQLSSHAIEEFKDIYLEEFGKALSNDEAHEIALRLLRFLQTLEPLPAAGPR